MKDYMIFSYYVVISLSIRTIRMKRQARLYLFSKSAVKRVTIHYAIFGCATFDLFNKKLGVI